MHAGDAGRGDSVVTGNDGLDPWETAALFGIRAQPETGGDAKSYDEGGPDDPYWQTERGRELYVELTAGSARRAQEKATELAAAAERNRIEREAEQKAWAERRRIEDTEKAETSRIAEEVERERREARFAEMDREAAARQKASADFCASDEDFMALEVGIDFDITGVPGPAGSDYGTERWVLLDRSDPDEDDYDDDAGAYNSAAIERVKPEIDLLLAPFVERLVRLGFVRADSAFRHRPDLAEVAGVSSAELYLIVGAKDFDGRLSTLADWPEISISLPSLKGPELQVRSWARLVNASLLYEALSSTLPLSSDELDVPEKPAAWPVQGEDRAAWLSRRALPYPAVKSLLERWEAVGGDPEMFDYYGSVDERVGGNKEAEYLVGARIPRAGITLLVADGGVGKSSLAQEIADALGCIERSTVRPRTVLGAEVTGRYVVAMISGEDPIGKINDRERCHAKIWGTSLVFHGRPDRYESFLAQCESMPILDLLIVDPARKFMSGFEDNSDVVSEFYDKLERIAARKNCAVIVVHHLTKGRPPSSLSQMLLRVRGSVVHVNRPRLVLGAREVRKGLIEIGPIKHNLDGLWLEVNQGMLLQQDPETYTLIPVTSQPSHGQDTNLPAVQVMAAIDGITNEGGIARRSGKRGLFELRTAELAGLSRGAVLEAIAALIQSGALIDGAAGLQRVIPDSAGTRG